MLKKIISSRFDFSGIDFKKNWPDIPADFPLRFYEGSRLSTKAGAEGTIKKLPELGLSAEANILDIGCGQRNLYVNNLVAQGYQNALGIDVDEIIGPDTAAPAYDPARHALQVNFRDLPLTQHFSVIYFQMLFDYLASERWAPGEACPLELFLAKIHAHLKAPGYIFSAELLNHLQIGYSGTYGSHMLRQVLIATGFERVPAQNDESLGVWRAV